MGEVVDAIIAQLEVRLGTYAADFATATKAADAHTAALKRLADADRLADEMMRRPSARGARGSNEAAEATAAVNAVKQAAKDKLKAESDAAKAGAAAVKAAEREKAAETRAATRAAQKAAADRAAAEKAASEAAIAAAEREAAARVRLAEVAQRAVDRRAEQVRPAANSTLGSTRTYDTPAKPLFIPQSYLDGEKAAARAIPSAALIGSGASNAEVEREINHLLADDLSLRARSIGAVGAEAAAIRDKRAEMQLIAGYQRAGLTDDQAALRIEEDLAVIARNRAVQAERAAAAEQARTAAARAAAERELHAQTNQTADHLTLLAPTIVGGITAHEVSALNDEYTKLSNSLKVAGVSAGDLDQVQAHLLQTANRTGTDINALADLYRSSALASHDLGASQQDLLKVSDAVANALRIGGRSSEEARGAILQLGHAFESGRVTAREFNSLALNLYPVLQAVAKGSDQFGGSVAKLRQALIDGDITSKVFFQDLLKGSDDLAKRASAASLTTAQGFTALRNSLVVYFGEADKAQGVSTALGLALSALARNLDTLIPAIVAVGSALAVGYVVRMGAAAAATANLGASILAAFGGPVGLTITAVALAVGSFAVAANNAAEQGRQAEAAYADLQDRLKSTAGGAHLAASGVTGLGNDALGAIPHVNAFAGAVGNLAQQLYNQARAARTARLESLEQQLTAGQNRERSLAAATPEGRNASVSDLRRGDFLGNIDVLGRAATGSIRSLLSGGRTDREAERGYAAQVAVNRDLQQQINAARTAPITATDIPGGAPVVGGISAKAQKQVDKLKADVAGLEQLAGGATGARLDRIKKQIDIRNRKIADIEAGVTSGAANAAEGGGGRGRRGPSADTLARRAEAAKLRGIRDDREFDAALRQATSGELSAQADLTDDPVARANVERDRIRFAAEQTAKELATKGPKSAGNEGGTGEYTAAEVKQLQDINARTEQLNFDKIDLAERRRNADDARSLERAGIENQRQALQAQQGLATTVAQRRDIALQLLDLDYKQREADLRATLAPDSTASATDKRIATDRLKLLPGQKAVDRQNIDKQNQGAGAAYLDRISPDRGEFIQSEEVKTLDAFNKGLDSSVAKALHLHGIFGDIIGDLIDMAIKQALIKPLANSLFGGQAAGGGGLGGLLGSLAGAIGIGGGSAAASARLASGASDYLSSFGAGIPGFANGGSATIGGNPGVDQNVLSINGRPSLRVGQGEQLTVTPIGAVNRKVSTPVSNTTVVHAPQFNLDGAVVTADLYADMQRISAAGIKAAAPHIARAGALGSQQVQSTAARLGPVNS